MRRALAVAVGLVALAGPALLAQSDSSCASRLVAPSDSVMATFVATIASFDDKRTLPRSYATLLAEGIRQELRLPSPLIFTAFETVSGDSGGASRGVRAAPAMSALYSVMLDGPHLRGARLLSGTVSPGFDLAVRNAFVALDSSGDLPPLPDSANSGPLEVRVTIAREDLARRPAPSDTASVPVPLFRLRLPAYAVTQRAGRRPGAESERLAPRGFHPDSAGSIRVEVRVGESGDIDPTSMRVVSFSSLELARVVFPRVARMQFQPLVVEGCPVAALETVVFEYRSIPVRVR